MRWLIAGVATGLTGVHVPAAQAEDRKETSQRVIGGVISGLLGEPAPAPETRHKSATASCRSCKAGRT